jgi:pilus assembly protein CpaE
LRLARQVRLLAPDAAIIGFGCRTDGIEMEQVAEAGVTEILESPLSVERFQAAVVRGVQARPLVDDNLVAFLPAKAGSGSTTVAANVAGSLARDLDKKALLMEADSRSGVLSVMFRLKAEYSLAHALGNVDRLDGTLWRRIVVKAQGVDFLVAPEGHEGGSLRWADFHQLLQFVKPRYDAVVADLPELVNDATVEIVRRARSVFIVCTAEMPSLVLARQRRRELREHGIADRQVEFIVNRWNRHDCKKEHIEELLERPLSATFQNDYACVYRAMTEGRLVGPRSELGQAFRSFASKLAGVPAPTKPARPRFAFLGSLLHACASDL